MAAWFAEGVHGLDSFRVIYAENIEMFRVMNATKSPLTMTALQIVCLGNGCWQLQHVVAKRTRLEL